MWYSNQIYNFITAVTQAAIDLIIIIKLLSTLSVTLLLAWNRVYDRPMSKISQYTCPMSYNTPARTEMCTLVHYGVWDMCILGFVDVFLLRFNIDMNTLKLRTRESLLKCQSWLPHLRVSSMLVLVNNGHNHKHKRFYNTPLNLPQSLAVLLKIKKLNWHWLVLLPYIHPWIHTWMSIRQWYYLLSICLSHKMHLRCICEQNTCKWITDKILWSREWDITPPAVMWLIIGLVWGPIRFFNTDILILAMELLFVL